MSRSTRASARRSEPPSTSADANAGRSGAANRLILALLVVGGLVAAAHWPVLNARALALDDDVFVTYNPLVTRPSWDSARRFFVEVLNPSTIHAYYLPLSMTSLMVDYALGGRPNDPRVFHRTQLALHLATTLLVLLLLRRLLGSLPAAAVGALLFGLHPLTVEPIASIGERKTLLATALAFASIAAHLRWVDGRRIAWRVASVALFALALLAKPSVTTLPVLLLILDAWPLRRFSWAAVVEKWPFAALSLASGAITILSVAHTWDFGPLPKTSAAQSLIRACYAVGFYLGKIVRPVDLSPIYPPPQPFALANPTIALGVFAALAATILALIATRATRAPLAGWSLFLVALAPTFGILAWSTVIAYDRYIYFPALGLVLALAAGFAYAWRAAAIHGAWARVLILAAVLVAAGGEALATRATLANWLDSKTIWTHAVRVAPTMPESHNGLGTVLETLREHDAAIAEFRRAVALDPNYWFAHVNLGNALLRRGENEAALDHLRRARAGLPGDPQAAYSMGVAWQRAGRLDEAEAELRRAIARRPDYWEAMCQLGAIMALRGRVDEAMAMVGSAARIAPQQARPPFWMAMILVESGGREREAIALLGQAVRLDPNWPEATNQLAWLLATLPDPALRDPERARQLAKKAVELTGGNDAKTLDTWAAAEASAGRFDDAARVGRQALAAADRTGPDTLAAAIRARLSLYERGRSYVEAPGGP